MYVVTVEAPKPSGNIHEQEKHISNTWKHFPHFK